MFISHISSVQITVVLTLSALKIMMHDKSLYRDVGGIIDSRVTLPFCIQIIRKEKKQYSPPPPAEIMCRHAVQI